MTSITCRMCYIFFQHFFVWIGSTRIKLVHFKSFTDINGLTLRKFSLSCWRRYYEIINQDSGSARRIRRRVNQRVSQGLRPIALERLLHRILLAQQNNTISRDPRMDLSHILNTSRDLSTSNSSHDSRDPRMNLSHILNTFRDSRMNLNHILNSSQDPRMNLNFILNNSLNHG
ncbi:unnamed protein product [Rhizophagus irregularis]|nr:unnamed protein product [Rhizophagus irregularis]